MCRARAVPSHSPLAPCPVFPGPCPASAVAAADPARALFVKGPLSPCLCRCTHWRHGFAEDGRASLLTAQSDSGWSGSGGTCLWRDPLKKHQSLESGPCLWEQVLILCYLSDSSLARLAFATMIRWKRNTSNSWPRNKLSVL